MNIEEFYSNNTIDPYFNHVKYAQKHPDTQDFYQPYCFNHNIDDKHRLFFHYVQYNKRATHHLDYSLVKEPLDIRSKGCHVFSFESCEPDTDLFYRQYKAATSYSTHKHNSISIYNLGTNLTIEGINSTNQQSNILNNLLLFGISSIDDQDYIIFTNSDCYIESQFYEFILSSKYRYIEFFRCEIINNQQISHHKHGIDGFAILKQELNQLLLNNLLPPNLIIGAPYWDAVFSNVCHKYIDSIYQDTKRLKHIKHPKRWNFYKLNPAGKNNLDYLNYLYDKKIINQRKVELIYSSLVIKVFDSYTDYKKVAESLQNSSTDFDYNYLFIEVYNNIKYLNDTNLGSTIGTRIHIQDNIDINDDIEQAIKEHAKKYSRIIILDQYAPVSLNTQFLPQHNFQ